MRRLRVPAVLAVVVLGCDGDKGPSDARIGDGMNIVFGDGNCGALCFPDGSDAGVCPDPVVCTSNERTCPAGCFCTSYCLPTTAQGELNCPRPDGGFPQCSFPDQTCPDGCTLAT